MTEPNQSAIRSMAWNGTQFDILTRTGGYDVLIHGKNGEPDKQIYGGRRIDDAEEAAITAIDPEYDSATRTIRGGPRPDYALTVVPPPLQGVTYRVEPYPIDLGRQTPYCTRCQRFFDKVFLVTREPFSMFLAALPELPPDHVRSCKDCLTDKEVAELFVPAALLVIEELCLPGASGEAQDAAYRIASMLRLWYGYERDPRQKARELL